MHVAEYAKHSNCAGSSHKSKKYVQTSAKQFKMNERKVLEFLPMAVFTHKDANHACVYERQNSCTCTCVCGLRISPDVHVFVGSFRVGSTLASLCTAATSSGHNRVEMCPIEFSHWSCFLLFISPTLGLVYSVSRSPPPYVCACLTAWFPCTWMLDEGIPLKFASCAAIPLPGDMEAFRNSLGVPLCAGFASVMLLRSSGVLGVSDSCVHPCVESAIIWPHNDNWLFGAVKSL
jgi:hypothetical protein